MSGVFEFSELEKEKEFLALVGDHLKTIPADMLEAARISMPKFECTHTVDTKRLKLAHTEYMLNLKRFALLLGSSNPDQYKRAGALLNALHKAGVITDIHMTGTEPVSTSGTSEKFVKFWQANHNQALAFDFAFACCSAYEDEVRGYSFKYLSDTCRYLRESPDLSIDSCHMLFASLYGLYLPEK